MLAFSVTYVHRKIVYIYVCRMPFSLFLALSFLFLMDILFYFRDLCIESVFSGHLYACMPQISYDCNFFGSPVNSL